MKYLSLFQGKKCPVSEFFLLFQRSAKEKKDRRLFLFSFFLSFLLSFFRLLLLSSFLQIILVKERKNDAFARFVFYLKLKQRLSQKKRKKSFFSSVGVFQDSFFRSFSQKMMRPIFTNHRSA